MTSLLVLLGLLSVATLASREGAFAEAIARAATPVLVLVGVALSPAGLGFLTPSTVASLDAAIMVGVCWLALITGLRASAALTPALTSSSSLRAVGFAFLTTTITAAVAALVLAGAAAAGDAFVDAKSIGPAAVLVGASLAGMPGERGATPARAAYAATAELLVVAAALGALAVWSGPTSAITVVAIGVLGAIVVQLLLAPGDPAPVPAAVAYLAVTTLVSGLSRLSHLPAAVAGFVLGAVAGRLRGRDVVEKLLLTERPVRIVVTTVLAASTSFAVADVVAGALLGVGVVLVQLAVTLPLHDGRSLFKRMASTVATSTTPLVAVASFAEARIDGAQHLVGPVIVAVAVADAVAFSFSLAGSRRDEVSAYAAKRP